MGDTHTHTHTHTHTAGEPPCIIQVLHAAPGLHTTVGSALDMCVAAEYMFVCVCVCVYVCVSSSYLWRLHWPLIRVGRNRARPALCAHLRPVWPVLCSVGDRAMCLVRTPALHSEPLCANVGL